MIHSLYANISLRLYLDQASEPVEIVREFCERLKSSFDGGLLISNCRHGHRWEHLVKEMSPIEESKKKAFVVLNK